MHVAHKYNLVEPTHGLRLAQWMEVIFETIPQILFQSVFIIQTFNFGNNDIVTISLFWSVISASNKYIAIDKQYNCFNQDMNDANLKCKKTMINTGWLNRALWVCNMLHALYMSSIVFVPFYAYYLLFN